MIVIVGETASGKTALAIELAERFNGEIICADSRTVYKGMDIGTAKPTVEEQKRVRHYLIDVVEPDELFSVAEFKRLTLEAVKDITSRGKLPILVGGTGLYVDSVLFDFQFNDKPNPVERERLSKMAIAQLQEEINQKKLQLPENAKNPRHLMRVIETGGVSSVKKPLRRNTLLLGLSVPRNILQQRITDRVEAMVASGLIEEVRGLSERYGWDIESMKAPGYKAFRGYLEKTISLDEAKALFIRGDTSLARRQRTWFKRNNSIHWLSNRDDAVSLVGQFLNKHNT